MIPLSSDDIQTYVPNSLRNLPKPPEFKFRPYSFRLRQRFTSALIREGIRWPEQAVIHARLRQSLQQLWDAETYSREIVRLDAVLEKERAGTPLSDEESVAFDELVARIRPIDPVLGGMYANMANFNQLAPLLAFSILCVGWSNLPVTYRREADEVPLEAADAATSALVDLELAHQDSSIEGIGLPGTAWLELGAHCLLSINGTLSRLAEKNSPSPSGSVSGQDGSMPHGMETMDGDSTAVRPSGAESTRRRSPRKN